MASLISFDVTMCFVSGVNLCMLSGSRGELKRPALTGHSERRRGVMTNEYIQLTY